jgi:hypothetical protein
MNETRREFLADVGRGMLIASVGPAVAAELGLARVWADRGPDTLTFGKLEPLVSWLQDTPCDKMLPAVVAKWRSGTELRTLVAAAALANARTFGGQDYDGYHCFMALAPAYHMAQEMPEDRGALPVLKVLYRNSNRMQRHGGREREVLHPLPAANPAQEKATVAALRAAVDRVDYDGAEQTFRAMARGSIPDAYNQLQEIIQDEADVHRVVLAWRSWAVLDLTGQEQAANLLRQSVRYCVDSCGRRAGNHRGPGPLRTLLPKLLDQYKLVGKPIGKRKADNDWIEHLSMTIYGAGREQAAEAAAAALAEGFSPEAVGEAMSLASNRLLLCDPGRSRDEGDKPKGSVHGASVGVHASDSANAWRNIARVSNARNTVASLIVGAYHTAGQQHGLNPEPYPLAEHLEAVKGVEPGDLLGETEAAIKAKDQARACALVHRYGTLGQPARPVFDLLLRYAVSEDGSLHAEKYYRTVTEEFAAAQPAFRGRHLAALARVTASEYGTPAPGYAEACRLLKA